MDRVALAQELVKLAKQLTASDSVMKSLIPTQEMMKLKDKVDEQTWELAREVYIELDERLRLKDGEQEAFNRLKNSLNSSYGADLHRNNIFKAANLLGIKLPSSMF